MLSLTASLVVRPAARPAKCAARRAAVAGRASALAVRPVGRRAVARLAARAEGKEIDVQEILTESAAKVGEAWEQTEDKPAVVTLLGFGFVGLWATAGILKGVDQLPVVPQLFELVGIAFSSWFIYRYLLFKPDREELKRTLEELKNKILA